MYSEQHFAGLCAGVRGCQPSKYLWSSLVCPLRKCGRKTKNSSAMSSKSKNASSKAKETGGSGKNSSGKQRKKLDEDEANTHVDMEGKRISIVGADRLTVAKVLSKAGANAAVFEEIDLTENSLTALPNLGAFTGLKTLVLDNNSLTGLDKMPPLSSLQNLWLNSNRVTELSELIANVSRSCPGLKYLSIMKNPCSPQFLDASSTDNMNDYQMYRYFVLNKLKHLTFLDFMPGPGGSRVFKPPERFPQ
jgi:hypothetical protein